VVQGMDAALAAAAGAPEVMVIGGAELFRLFLPRATRIHLTRVHGDIAGDVMWPALDATWEAVARERHEADERHACAMTFEVWEKRR
jgi:dihydrofolate reductase